jgi:hypothetical protein
MAEKQAEKYVVTHTMVNDWPQGTVLERDHFRVGKGRDAYGRKSSNRDTGDEAPEHDQFDRLLALGAIRPATEQEAGLSRVTVLPFGVAMSAEAQALVATKDAEIDQLTKALAAVRDKAAFHEARGTLAPAGPPQEDPTLAPVLAEKDAQIAMLRQQIEATQEAVAGAQEQLTARDEEAGKAAAELRGGREFPAQSTGYGEGNPAGAAEMEDPSGRQQAQQAQQEQQEAANRRAEAQRQRREREAREKQQQ